MTEWSDGFKMAVTAIVLVVVVSIVFAFVYIGQNAANEGEDKLATSVSGLSEKEYQKYNGTVLSGGTAAATIEQFSTRPDFVVCLKTKANSATLPTGVQSLDSTATNYIKKVDTNKTRFFQGSNNAGTIYTKSEKNYVNPAAQFKSGLVYDANGVVIGITLEQQ